MTLRLDQFLVQAGFCDTRSKARQLILDGKVFTDAGVQLTKPSQVASDDLRLHLVVEQHYVSRGADKLLAAMAVFQPPIAGCTALDLGASTGGFTDVLLRHGAACVYAVDVGTEQLHPSLKDDPRVISLEQTNARTLSRQLIPVPIDLLVADLSFISLRQVLPAAAPLLVAGAWVIVLVKPQFEAGRQQIGKQGVVKDPVVRQVCLEQIVDFAVKTLGWSSLGSIPSPVIGPKGNQEFLAAFRVLPSQPIANE